MTNSVDDRVAHIEVAGGQVDLGTQGVLVILKFALAHSAEQIQVFLDGTVPVGRDSGRIQVTAVLLELLGRQLTDISQALLDQLNGVLIVLFKVVGTKEETVAPVKAQPVNIVLNGFHELHIFFGGVGIVHTQIAHAAVLLGGTEIDDQSLAVTDVQIAVGLRREPGVHGLTGELSAFGNILIDKGMNEIFAFGDFSHIVNILSFLLVFHNASL